MPKVSIITPVYNVEKYLPRCLDSLINQTLSDIEIICVNDCSPDNSLKVLKEYSLKDERIKIIDLKENQGVSIARNKGIEIASGEYLGFVDSDDKIELDFCEKLYLAAKEKNLDITKGNLKVIKDNVEQSQFKDLNNKIRENKYNFNCNFSSALYKTSLIKEKNIFFPINLPLGEDRIFLINALVNSETIDIIDDAYYVYLHNEVSATNSSNITKAFSCCWDTLNILIPILNNSNALLNPHNILFILMFYSWGS